MEHPQTPDPSSLQAILYIDTEKTSKPKPRYPGRLPNALAIGICAVAAAGAVGAVTYKFNAAPAVARQSAPIRVRVTHAAAAVVAPKTAPRITVIAPQSARTTPLPQVVAQRASPAPLPTTAATAQPKAPATAKPLATAMPTAEAKPAVTAAPIATAAPTPVAVVPQAKPPTVVARHHVVHRKLAAVAPPAVAAAPVQAQSIPTDPAITAFDASPATIPAGSGATLCVSARHAVQLSISNIGEVNPLLLDCRHVSPVVTTTYTAWAVNSIGVTVSQNVTVTVTH